MSSANSNNHKKSDFYRDSSIENAASFEEARAIIETRLKTLRQDLSGRTPAEDTIIAEILKAHEDKKLSLMDLYAGYYSPCKVTDTVFEPKGQGDMNDVMLSFSEGFNEFIENMEEQYVSLIMKRRRATILLNRMLSIRFPYSRLMYLYYYKGIDPKDITELFFISRATFYRLKSAAINSLTGLYYNSKKKRHVDDSQESAV